MSGKKLVGPVSEYRLPVVGSWKAGFGDGRRLRTEDVRGTQMSVRDREDAVIARLHSLAPHLDGEPDPEFRAATRARLVAMAAVRSPAPEPISPLRRLLTEGSAAPARWRTRLTAGLAGAALAVTALATVVAVASDARPGDVLYDLKRGTEETQLVLAGDARGQTLLDLASTRLEEVRALVESGATALPAAGSSATGETVLAAGADAALVEETLDDHGRPDRRGRGLADRPCRHHRGRRPAGAPGRLGGRAVRRAGGAPGRRPRGGDGRRRRLPRAAVGHRDAGDGAGLLARLPGRPGDRRHRRARAGAGAVPARRVHRRRSRHPRHRREREP